MDIRGRETTGHRTDITPALPTGTSHAVQHPMGRGSGCSGGLKGHGDRTGSVQGGTRSGTHDGAGSSGGHGGSPSKAPAPSTASKAGALLLLPMSLLGVGSSIGHLGALCRRGH